ncbi:MAG: phosphoribosyltransferase [Acetobacteraceae bacterium]
MTFADRREAGRLLAQKLLHFKDQRPVVLALPRGGVPVGFEIARALRAPLDLVLAQKLGAPNQPELAVGAIADGAEPELVTDPRLLAALSVSSAALDAIKDQALAEVERRGRTYRGDRPPVALAGRTAIVVDDGIATGATTRAALRASRRREPARLVLAVPVAPPATIRRLKQEADAIVCLVKPRLFAAVGQYYESFPQLDDEEVLSLLAAARGFTSSGAC